MKLFSTLFLLLSINAFAQYNDGFHAEPEVKCTTGECLMVDDRPIEMIEMIDREGYSYSKVSSRSSIINILEGNSKVCFNGRDITKLDAIISALVGVTNSYYVQGGHFAIDEYIGTHSEIGFVVTMKVISDYNPREYELIKTISSCQ